MLLLNTGSDTGSRLCFEICDEQWMDQVTYMALGSRHQSQKRKLRDVCKCLQTHQKLIEAIQLLNVLHRKLCKGILISWYKCVAFCILSSKLTKHNKDIYNGVQTKFGNGIKTFFSIKVIHGICKMVNLFHKTNRTYNLWL